MSDERGAQQLCVTPTEFVRERVEYSLDGYREPIAAELARFLPSDSPLSEALYDPIRHHALKPGKGLRPAICLATCRALGGSLEAALPTAAVLELYHNAFLVHDDVEDGSLERRDAPALHVVCGVAAAINAGDAMLALALRPLLDNTRLLGLGKSLRVLEVIADMTREAAEGQAIELDWIRRGEILLTEAQYVEMVAKKTASYSFVAPVELGATIAGASDACIAQLRRFSRALGIAFQIRDDLLNLQLENALWGKDELDDLWEGKRTLVLLHALSRATGDERRHVEAVLRKPRPDVRFAGLVAFAAELEHTGDLTHEGRKRLEAELATKSRVDVEYLLALIARADSVRHAEAVAEQYAVVAQEEFDALGRWLVPSSHRDFLGDLVVYVRNRQY
jgi:geranylgeranyl diphosphate synthase type II